MSDWTAMTAARLNDAIDAGRADPRDITEAFLTAIDANDPDFQIYARATADRARHEADMASARAKSGTRRSPMDGMPVTWKDLIDTQGTPTESGTQLLKGRTPDADAAILSNATQAGAVCLGKTHQTEFAFSGLGLNPNTATPPNKSMPGHVPGGSSSGAAASLTHDLAAIAIGSDTGGSVRIPACWNNLVGLKVTHGRLSNDGLVPLCPGFDTPGPLARTVEDCALAFAALAGERYRAPEAIGISSLRILIPETMIRDDSDPTVLEAFDAAVEKLKQAGAHVSSGPMQELVDVMPLGPDLFPYEAWQSWGELIEKYGERMFPPVRERFEQGKDVTREQYDAAWKKLGEIRARHLERFKDHDAIITPTVAILPPEIAKLEAEHSYFTERNLMALRNTRFFNMLGNCALTLPLPQTACGLQIIAAPNSEEKLLSMGLALENTVAS